MVVGLGNFAASPLLFHELHDGREEVAQRQLGVFLEIIDQLNEPKIVVAAATPCAAKPYPLDTCLVSGEKLGEMGKPFEIGYEGQQIQFCCKNCAPEFAKDPAKYLSKLK